MSSPTPTKRPGRWTPRFAVAALVLLAFFGGYQAGRYTTDWWIHGPSRQRTSDVYERGFASGYVSGYADGRQQQQPPEYDQPGWFAAHGGQ